MYQSFAVLGVNRESPRAEISKAYRKLAGRWHPDRFQKREEKEEAEKTFLKIAAAYDVLKDEESREEYNYMLDHPEEMWQNYYRYYRRRMAPKVSVRGAIKENTGLIGYSDTPRYMDKVSL